MKYVIECNGGYYPYSKVNNRGHEKLQVKIKVGKYPNGRDRYITASANSEKELKVALQKLLSKNVTIDEEPTLEQLANQWLSYKYGIVGPATFDKVESVVHSQIVPKIGKEQLSLIDEPFINRYLEYLAVRGNTRTKKPTGLAYNTLKKVLSVLREMFEYAYRFGYVEKNYAKYAVIPRRAKHCESRRILDDNGFERFICELNKKDINGNYIHYYRNAILFMLLTGLRTCEVFALEKDCVDFKNRVITVKRNRIRVRNRNISGEREEGYTTAVVNETKNKSSERIVPLTNDAFKILKESCENSSSNICFPNKNGGIVKPTTFDQKFKKITEKAMVDITPYSLRHTFATNFYYNSELSVDVLTKILGHTTPKVTYNTYIHQIATKESKIADSLENMYKTNILS